MTRPGAAARAAVAAAWVLTLAACGPSASGTRVGWPTEVMPDVRGDSGSLVIQGEADYAILGGLEGNQPFVRALDASGQISLEQHFQWPTTRHELPPGSYTVSVYALSCSGNCDFLDPLDAGFRCEVMVRISPDSDSVVVVHYAASLTCSVKPSG